MPNRFPRTSHFMGSVGHPTIGTNGTWIESEEMAYPSGAKKRRCMARELSTGKLKLVYCRIPDTYFSIPCKGGGWVEMNSDNGEFEYHA